MSQPDATPAVSSTAPASSGDVLASLSETELSAWRQTGTLPGQEDSSSSPAESTPAEPAVQAAETSASSDAPASEPGQPKKKNAESRKAELDAEIQSLLKQRADLRKDLEQAAAPRPTPAQTLPAASSPATDVPLSRTLDLPDVTKPPLTEQEFFAQYPDAGLVDLQRYVARYELVADRHRTAVQQDRSRRYAAFAEQVQQAKASDPTFLDGIAPRLITTAPVDELPPGVPPTAGNVIAQEILTSPVAPALLRHLSAHPDELDRLERLPHAAAIARAIGQLEAKLETPSAVTPAVKTTSSAPPPPMTVGSKPAATVDDADEAIAKGDVARYIAIMNRRELAAR